MIIASYFQLFGVVLYAFIIGQIQYFLENIQHQNTREQQLIEDVNMFVFMIEKSIIDANLIIRPELEDLITEFHKKNIQNDWEGLFFQNQLYNQMLWDSKFKVRRHLGGFQKVLPKQDQGYLSFMLNFIVKLCPTNFSSQFQLSVTVFKEYKKYFGSVFEGISDECAFEMMAHLESKV